MWLFGTERARPLARGQEGSAKQGREVERDVRRKYRHGEERVYVCHKEILGDRDGTTWVGDRVTRCVRDRRYLERYQDRRMDGRRQYVCS